MKTITLQEAFAQASPPPLLNRGRIIEKTRRVQIAEVYGPSSEFSVATTKANAALLAHCFNTLPDLVAAIRLDLAFHSRFFATTSLEDFRAMGYTGSDDANQMRDFLHKLKVEAMTKASQVQIPD